MSKKGVAYIMTQFIRRLDHMNRIVIPSDYRKKVGIAEMTEVRITEENGKIIIEKLTPSCKICGATENLHSEMCVCQECIDKIKAL